MDLLEQNMTGTTKLTKVCFFRDTACDGGVIGKRAKSFGPPQLRVHPAELLLVAFRYNEPLERNSAKA